MLVVKVGGGEGLDLGNVVADLATLPGEWVLFHGGNAEMTRLQERLGRPARFVTSVSGYASRVTDPEAIDAMAMSYRGKINLRLVEALQRRGVNAVGLSGVDGGLIRGRRKEAIKIVEDGKRKVLRDDHTGTPEEVNVGLLRLLLAAGYRPVVTVPILSREGEALNTDGDRAAARIAEALGAETYLILSDVPGLLRRYPDEATLIRRIPVGKLEEAAAFAEGRMRKKLLGAREALERGVGRVILASANVQNPVRAALAGGGTHIAEPARLPPETGEPGGDAADADRERSATAAGRRHGALTGRHPPGGEGT